MSGTDRRRRAGDARPGVAASGAAPDEAGRDFAAYMRARQPSLLRTAYLLTGDRHAAEDLVQTALAKLFLSWDRVRDREALDGYVRRILVNEYRSSWRRPWRRLERSTAAPPETEHRDVYDDGSGAALWDAVRTLPPRQRAVVVLRYYEELGEREIADLLGIAPGTVKSQASRALATLRERAPEALRAYADPMTDPTPPDAGPDRGREEDR